MNLFSEQQGLDCAMLMEQRDRDFTLCHSGVLEECYILLFFLSPLCLHTLNFLTLGGDTRTLVEDTVEAGEAMEIIASS